MKAVGRRRRLVGRRSLPRPSAEPRELLLYGATLLDAPRAGKLRPASKRAGSPHEAVWVRGDRIAAVGPYRDLRTRTGRKALRVDLGGGTLMPGFTDSHIHLVTWHRALGEPWLESQAPEAIERALDARVRAAPDETWRLLRGWVPREWPLERRRRELLDRLSPDHPLVLFAVDGHSVWANGAALARVGIDERTAAPSGGAIERDPSGALTGALIEEARKLLLAGIERRAGAEADLEGAIQRARSLGITSAHDFDRGATWRAAAAIEREGGLGIRLLVSVPVASLQAAVDLGVAAGLGGDRLRVGPVKMFADGTLGSATALLEAPYQDGSSPGGIGMEVMSAQAMREAGRAAKEAGLSVAIHAIGDRAVRNALDAIEGAMAGGTPFPLPPRVEHVQLSREEDWPRFRDLGVIASVQPAHLITDRGLAGRLWGERTARAYAWRSLAMAGARLIFGSDAPFDRAGPLRALQAALLRRRGDEPPDRAERPEQRLTLARALRAHLEDPHRVAGWPLPLGRLEPCWGADLVHFDHDLTRTPPEAWDRVSVLGVWIDGTQASGRSSERRGGMGPMKKPGNRARGTRVLDR